MVKIAGMDPAMTSNILADMQKSAGLDFKSDSSAETPSSSSSKSFADILKDGVLEVNQFQKVAESMSTDIATGKSQDLHETMLAMTQADLSFNLMVQVRNKVLEAYQDVMRMPV